MYFTIINQHILCTCSCITIYIFYYTILFIKTWTTQWDLKYWHKWINDCILLKHDNALEASHTNSVSTMSYPDAQYCNYFNITTNVLSLTVSCHAYSITTVVFAVFHSHYKLLFWQWIIQYYSEFLMIT